MKLKLTTLVLFFAMSVIILAALPLAGFSQIPAVKMELTSPAFKQAGTIPDQFTCKGENTSPALSWSGEPDGTKSFAVVAEDPDAPKGTFTHWVVYNIDPGKMGLPANLQKSDHLDGLMQGKNDAGVTGYSGPCPPKGNGPHRYFFNILALDITLNLQSGADKAAVENAMTGHKLAQGDLMGLYEIK